MKAQSELPSNTRSKRKSDAGQIIARGKRKWLVRIYRGGDAVGKRTYMNTTIHGNKKAAVDYLNRTLTAISNGTFVERSPLTLNQYLDKWYEAATGKVRLPTLEDYKSLMRRYVADGLGRKRLSEVRALDISTLYTSMQQQGLSARTIRYTGTVLSAALKQACRWGMLALNPCTMVDAPKQQRREMVALSPAEAARFISAAKDDPLYAFFLLALTTGARPSELLALRWADFDFQRQTITITRAVHHHRKGGGYSFSEPKTPKSRRSIPVSASTVAALKLHRAAQLEQRLKQGSDYENLDLEFATSIGTPIMQRNIISRHLAPILKRAQLPPSITLYTLRHSCATLLLNSGENLKTIAARLGHANEVLTLTTYAHLQPGAQESATQRLEQTLFG